MKIYKVLENDWNVPVGICVVVYERDEILKNVVWCEEFKRYKKDKLNAGYGIDEKFLKEIEEW